MFRYLIRVLISMRIGYAYLEWVKEKKKEKKRLKQQFLNQGLYWKASRFR